MGVRKNPDTGEIIEEYTQPVEDLRDREPATDPRLPRRPLPSRFDRGQGGGSTAFEERTVPFSEERRGGRTPAHQEERNTTLHVPDHHTPSPQPSEAEIEAGDGMADPVVGWLVVVAGPGKGQVCKLGYGTNSLGRGENSRARLDFGDEQISRENHAALTYDPRGRKFYLQHGGGVNLTYLGDAPVLTPTPLEPMQDFCIGSTTLRFVPFCGPDFDWQDLGP